MLSYCQINSKYKYIVLVVVRRRDNTLFQPNGPIEIVEARIKQFNESFFCINHGLL